MGVDEHDEEDEAAARDLFKVNSNNSSGVNFLASKAF